MMKKSEIQMLLHTIQLNAVAHVVYHDGKETCLVGLHTNLFAMGDIWIWSNIDLKCF